MLQECLERERYSVSVSVWFGGKSEALAEIRENIILASRPFERSQSTRQLSSDPSSQERVQTCSKKYENKMVTYETIICVPAEQYTEHAKHGE